MITQPIRLDRFQRALFEIVRDEVSDSTAWAFGEPSFDIAPQNYINLEPFGGPTPQTRRNARGRVIIPLESIDVRVLSMAPGMRPIIRLNGFDYATDTILGDTLDSIRDRLIAGIEEDELEPVSASVLTPDTLRLQADAFGAIYGLALRGPLVHANPVWQSPANLTEGSSLFLVRVRAYSKASEIWAGAPALISALEAALQTPDVIERLRAAGVGVVDIGSPVDITSTLGARWTTGSETILTFSLWASWTRPTDVIDSARVTQTALDLAGAQIETRTYQIG